MNYNMKAQTDERNQRHAPGPLRSLVPVDEGQDALLLLLLLLALRLPLHNQLCTGMYVNTAVSIASDVQPLYSRCRYNRAVVAACCPVVACCCRCCLLPFCLSLLLLCSVVVAVFCCCCCLGLLLLLLVLLLYCCSCCWRWLASYGLSSQLQQYPTCRPAVSSNKLPNTTTTNAP